MSLFLSPIGNDQFVDANGDPLTGGKIETYLAGSSTAAATYTSSAGTTPQANPIILNTLGAPASPIWLTGAVPYKFIIKNASGVTLRTIDEISGINDASVSQSEWVESGLVPTYISATSFSVPGDQTPILQIGRRLRTTNTSGLIYSTITNSAFAAGITTVTLANDPGAALDAGLSLVAYGLLSVSGSSIPPLQTGPKNKIINGAFAINQRLYVSGAATIAAQYTFDRWKVTGTGGLTFSTTANKTTVTIPSGQTLQQVVEGLNLQSGTFVLSWEGTAQGRIASGGYGASGAVTASITGGTNTTIEFNTGTVTNVQLEQSAVATPFEQRQIGEETALCQRFYQIADWVASGYASAGSQDIYTVVNFPVQMRAAPTVVKTAGSFTNSTDPGPASVNSYRYSAFARSSAVGSMFASYTIQASAEL